MRTTLLPIINCMFLLLIATSASAQQTAYTNFYRYSWQLLNPAAVDRSYMFNESNTSILSVTARQQWIGFEGGPTFYQISYENMPYIDQYTQSNVKWGFNVYKDATDKIGNYGIYGNFAYYIPLPYTKGKFIHIGISPGLVQYQVDINKIRFAESESFSEDAFNQLYADFSMGVFYRHQKKFYAGLSIPQTFALDLNDKQSNGLFSKDRLQHIYGVIGGFINLSENNYGGTSTGWIIEPSAWVRYVPGISYLSLDTSIPFSVDMDCRFYYNESLWFGLGYATYNYVKLEAGINKILDQTINSNNPSRLRFGFSFNFPVGSSGLNLGSNIELNAAYAWK